MQCCRLFLDNVLVYAMFCQCFFNLFYQNSAEYGHEPARLEPHMLCYTPRRAQRGRSEAET